MASEDISILVDGSGSFAHESTISTDRRSSLGYALDGTLNLLNKYGAEKTISATLFGKKKPIPPLFSSSNPPEINKALAKTFEDLHGLKTSTNLSPTTEYIRHYVKCDHLIIVSDGDALDESQTYESLRSFALNPAKKITFVLTHTLDHRDPRGLEESPQAKVARKLNAEGRNNVRIIFCNDAKDLPQMLDDVVEGKYAPARTANNDNELSELRKAFEAMGKRLEALEKKQQPEQPSSQWYTPYKPNGFDKK
ncbi:MAG: hypothetical protein H6867_05660 [Rhodospirillales bacterium]|nr:hypothetical protein [Rhodospirillales bacterium]MCB9995015.1 hypothetical protein [Rhodospirillales bacterium]